MITKEQAIKFKDKLLPLLEANDDVKDPGSHPHAGRPGKVGGSAPGTGTVSGDDKKKLAQIHVKNDLGKDVAFSIRPADKPRVDGTPRFAVFKSGKHLGYIWRAEYSYRGDDPRLLGYQQPTKVAKGWHASHATQKGSYDNIAKLKGSSTPNPTREAAIKTLMDYDKKLPADQRRLEDGVA